MEISEAIHDLLDAIWANRDTILAHIESDDERFEITYGAFTNWEGLLQGQRTDIRDLVDPVVQLAGAIRGQHVGPNNCMVL